MKKGTLIVLDGIDGSGKTTQINLLSGYLKKKGVDFEVISFPRYGNNQYTDQIERYLKGKESFDPYIIAKAYASDRLLAKSLIEQWLKKGKLVIANRYAAASKAHLGANMPEAERKAFFEWLDNLEYKENGIPRGDLTILLDVNPKVGQKNAVKKHKADIHEHDLKHLQEAAKIYLELSKSEPNWIVIDCMQDGQMRSPEDIHHEIVKILKEKLDLT